MFIVADLVSLTNFSKLQDKQNCPHLKQKIEEVGM